jgi:TIR domain
VDLFVSYTSEDKEKAFWIGREIQTLGHRPRIHDWEIPPGGDIVQWMERNIEYSDRVLCVVSHAYLAAPYSSWERKAASWASVSGRENFVIPIFIENCQPPVLMAHIKRCNLFGLSEEQARVHLVEFFREPSHLGRGAFPIEQNVTATEQETSDRTDFPVIITKDSKPSQVHDDAERHKSTLYISYDYYNAESIEWVKKVRAFFGSNIEIYDSWDRPALKRVASTVAGASECDAIICLLSEIYYSVPLLRDEFKEAIATANRSFSKRQKLPVTYLITFDKWAEKWLDRNYPDIPYKKKELYWFTESSDGLPLPVNPHSWEELKLDMTNRVRAAKQP